VPTALICAYFPFHRRAHDAVEAVVAQRDEPPKRGTMMRYMLRVYRGATYYPDKQVQSQSLGRLERRAQQLEREGYRVKLIAVTAAGPSTPPSYSVEPP
jgi:hypothetical protein